MDREFSAENGPKVFRNLGVAERGQHTHRDVRMSLNEVLVADDAEALEITDVAAAREDMDLVLAGNLNRLGCRKGSSERYWSTWAMLMLPELKVPVRKIPFPAALAPHPSNGYTVGHQPEV